MASVAAVLTGVLVLGGTASARAFHPDFSHIQLHKRGDNLINLRQEEAVADDNAPIIKAASAPVTLQPIRPNLSTKRTRRATQKAYDLMPEDTLYWGGEDGTLAELWIDASGETEAVVDMEFFDDLVDGMDCPRNNTGAVSIDFLDQVDLDEAGQIWSWVSEEADRSFLLMVGAGDCGWNPDRMLYRVTDIKVTPDSKIATLQAESIPWKDALHSYDLNVGRAAVHASHASTPEQARRRRSIFDDIGDAVGGVVDEIGNVVENVGDAFSDAVDTVGEGIGNALEGAFTPDLSVPFDIDISGKGVSFNANGIDVSGTCVNCTTKGVFDAQATFKVRVFELEEAVIEMSTPGIDATAIVALTIKGDISDALLERSFPLFKASPAGVAIPGTFILHPQCTHETIG